MNILVTGAAGFIGNALSIRLVEAGHSVHGVDNLNDFYDPSLKRARLARLEDKDLFTFTELDIADRGSIRDLFDGEGFEVVVNLAAQAGVRYSIDNPESYIDANLTGFANLLEACRHAGTGHLVYASSSSVYGANTRLPFAESDNVDHPVSLYAATKKSNELMAHCYAYLYGLPVTGLRFFTVYGPWGRPDMALFRFTRGILSGEPIDVYNHGNMVRDFTYIDDVIDGMLHVIPSPPAGNPDWNGDSPDPASSMAPYRVYNIGNETPVNLMHYIEVLEEVLGRKAELNFMEMQDGDVPKTVSDVSRLSNDFGYKPSTRIEEGVRRFVDWYRSYYQC